MTAISPNPCMQSEHITNKNKVIIIHPPQRLYYLHYSLVLDILDILVASMSNFLVPL